MKARYSMLLLFSVLTAAPVGFAQNQRPGQSPQPQFPAHPSENGALKSELDRIQAEISQIAQEMGTIDARMMQESTDKELSGISGITIQIHELLRNYDAGATTKAFLDSTQSQSHLRWGLCLKASKLYGGLLEKIFAMNKGSISGGEKNSGTPRIADELLDAAQLAFLARITAELELRYSELQFHLVATPDPKQQELWRRLREALQSDDRTYLEKLNALLANSGVSPPQFAAKVVTSLQKTSQTAATFVVEGMEIVSSEGDVWKLSEIPGVNPDFIRSLQCEQKAMKDFVATATDAALVQVSSCRKYADGSEILAFAAKSSDQAKSNNPVGKAQLTLDGVPLDSGALHLPTEKIGHDVLNPGGDTKSGTESQQDGSQPPTFGTTNLATPRPKIPSWWIRCQCPDDHPNAGLVVDGVRWHAPVLQCPNPELRLRELMKK